MHTHTHSHAHKKKTTAERRIGGSAVRNANTDCCCWWWPMLPAKKASSPLSPISPSSAQYHHHHHHHHHRPHHSFVVVVVVSLTICRLHCLFILSSVFVQNNLWLDLLTCIYIHNHHHQHHHHCHTRSLIDSLFEHYNLFFFSSQINCARDTSGLGSGQPLHSIYIHVYCYCILYSQMSWWYWQASNK